MSPSAPTSAHPPDLQQQARALCRTMAAIHRRGWCDGTGGNFSVVLSRAPELQLLMAPSGVDKGAVKPSELIVVDERGAVLQGSGKVSAEMDLHRAIVQTTGAGSVLHTHSQAATLLSRQALLSLPCGAVDGNGGLAPAQGQPGGTPLRSDDGGDERGAMVAHLTINGLEMLKGLEGIRTHDSRIRIPVLANDQDLPRLSLAAAPHLRDAPHGLLIAGHGLYAWGADLPQARRHLEILEFLLEQHWRQRLWNALIEQPA